MKKILVLFSTLFILVNYCSGQKIDTIYYNQKEERLTKENYSHYAIAKYDTNIIKVAIYSKNGQISYTGGFRSVDFRTMKGENTGPFYYYYNNRLERFELYEPSKYPEVLSSLGKILEKIPQQHDSLYLGIIYRKNGEIESVGYWSKCCDLIGTWVYYTKKHKYMCVNTYKNNILDGPSTVYRFNQVIEEGNYKEGKKSGEWYYYFDDGVKYKTEFYLDGEKIKVKL